MKTRAKPAQQKSILGANKFLIVTFVAIIILLIPGVYLASTINSPAEVQINPEAKAVIDEFTYNWGEIEINDGNVEKVFEITNAGNDSLILSNVETSCMCTTAQLSYAEESSPIFGMHTKSGYTLEVPSGKTAQLKIVFDPAFHGPSGVGPINRQVKVDTNDPSNPQLNFMLTAMVRK